MEDGNYINSDDLEMTTERLGSIRTDHFTPEEVDEIVYNTNIETNFVNNYDLFRGGNADNAILGFDNVLTRAPDHLFALFYKAVAYEKKNDHQEAKKYFLEANSLMLADRKWDKLVKIHGLDEKIGIGIEQYVA